MISRSLKDYFLEKKAEGFFDKEVRALSAKDLEAFEAFVLKLKPSLGDSRKLLKIAKEISRRDAVDISQIFEEYGLFEIISSENKKSRPQKLAAICEQLDRVRYPEKAALKDGLEDLKTKLRRTHGVDIELPKNFEGLALKTTISFRSESELKKKIEALAGLAESSELSQVYSLLKGEE